MNFTVNQKIENKKYASAKDIFADYFIKQLKKQDPVLSQFVSDSKFITHLTPTQVYICSELVKAIKKNLITKNKKETISFISAVLEQLSCEEDVKVDSWLEGYYEADE
tara:strand:+ start:60 stop:383 length:324 start_codon:yes stop_codon:yes gene_type:complete